MSLNLSTGGDFTPFIKYNAKAGRWFVRGDDGDVEVQNPRFAVDLENIKTGWIYFPQGGAPSFVWDKDGQRAARPSQQHKDGFEVMLYGADDVPGIGALGWRQWTSNANAAKAAMLKMYGEWEKNQQEGKVPVFQCTGVTVVPSDYGDNFEPNMVLEKWVERANLPSPPEPVNAPQSNGSGQVTMPPAGSDPAMQGPPPGHPANLDDEIKF